MNKYLFKNEHYGKDWQKWESASLHLGDVAEEIAEEYYSDDAEDPRGVEFVVYVKRTTGEATKFKVTAEARVIFSAEADYSEDHTPVRKTCAEDCTGCIECEGRAGDQGE